jgi:hypothetical protein
MAISPMTTTVVSIADMTEPDDHALEHNLLLLATARFGL